MIVSNQLFHILFVSCRIQCTSRAEKKPTKLTKQLLDVHNKLTSLKPFGFCSHVLTSGIWNDEIYYHLCRNKQIYLKFFFANVSIYSTVLPWLLRLTFQSNVRHKQRSIRDLQRLKQYRKAKAQLRLGWFGKRKINRLQAVIRTYNVMGCSKSVFI